MSHKQKPTQPHTREQLIQEFVNACRKYKGVNVSYLLLLKAKILSLTEDKFMERTKSRLLNIYESA